MPFPSSKTDCHTTKIAGVFRGFVLWPKSHDEFRRVLAIPASSDDSGEFRRLPVSGELSAEFPAVTRLAV